MYQYVKVSSTGNYFSVSQRYDYFLWVVLVFFAVFAGRTHFQEESEFLDPLREQLGYLASAKEVHRGRGRALDALQVTGRSLDHAFLHRRRG